MLTSWLESRSDVRLPKGWQKLPPQVFHLLFERAGHPGATVLSEDAGDGPGAREPLAPTAGFPPLSRNVITGQAGEMSQVAAITSLLKSLDAGSISVDMLNALLGAAALSPAMVQKAIEGMGKKPTEFTLNGAFYALMGGRLVPAPSPPDRNTPARWVGLVVLVAVLVLAGIVRYS